MNEIPHDVYPSQEVEKPPVEIERKFLVGTPPEGFEDSEHTRIRQGYLAIAEDGTEVRLRDKDGSCTMTVKSKGDLVRGEFEAPITEEQFAKWWPATEGKRVEKTRYEIPHGENIIEFDIYEGDLAGLMTAEVEFSSAEAANSFEAPEWFAVDVTSDKAFKNQQLALNGLPN